MSDQEKWCSVEKCLESLNVLCVSDLENPVASVPSLGICVCAAASCRFDGNAVSAVLSHIPDP